MTETNLTLVHASKSRGGVTRARLASLSDSGYAASREQAFADFKARWEFK